MSQAIVRGGVMGTENWGDVESIIQSLAVYGYEPLPKDDVVSRYQWLKKISEVTESEKIAFMKAHSTTVLWDASGRAIHALARLADVFFNEASTLREQIAREIEAEHGVFCQYQVQHFKEMALNWVPDTAEGFDKCSHLRDASIARGEK